jgi:mitochondrial splicing suppressor protein 51
MILGARAESSLPPHVWDQMCLLFPSAHFHLFFIGPQVSLPKPPGTESESKKQASHSGIAPDTESNTQLSAEQNKIKTSYLPNVYEPPTPAPIIRHKRTRSSIDLYGVPSYTVPFTPQLTITGMQTNYQDVHANFEDTFDPYHDVFFLFSPGFGFPALDAPEENPDLLQIASPTGWGPVLPLLLSTGCPIVVTGFSPTDVERDVRSLSTAPGVAGEFEWVVTPGPNAFGSEKWEVADFDPRVMVKTNWGVWAIRGKSRALQERGEHGLLI